MHKMDPRLLIFFRPIIYGQTDEEIFLPTHKSLHFALITSGLYSRTLILKSALLFIYSLRGSISCTQSQALLMTQNLSHPSFANVFFKGRLACLKITPRHNEETSESLLA